METMKLPIVSLFVLKSCKISPVTGATIDDASGVRKRKKDTSPRLMHFDDVDQLIGRSGSSSAHSTKLASFWSSFSPRQCGGAPRSCASVSGLLEELDDSYLISSSDVFACVGKELELVRLAGISSPGSTGPSCIKMGIMLRCKGFEESQKLEPPNSSRECGQQFASTDSVPRYNVACYVISG